MTSSSGGRRVRLEPLEDGAVPSFARRARETYERQMVDFGGIDPAFARVKAEEDPARLFPDGRPADDLFAFTVVDDDNVGEAGIVFFAAVPQGEKTVAFVYGIEVDETHRGRGFGRAAMLAVEAKARELGHDEVRLNVFAATTPRAPSTARSATGTSTSRWRSR